MDDSELAEAVSIRFLPPKVRPHPYRLVGETRRPTQVCPPLYRLSNFSTTLTNSLGNTCYMNATVQALRAIPELQVALTAYVAVYSHLLHR